MIAYLEIIQNLCIKLEFKINFFGYTGIKNIFIMSQQMHGKRYKKAHTPSPLLFTEMCMLDNLRYSHHIKYKIYYAYFWFIWIMHTCYL